MISLTLVVMLVLSIGLITIMAVVIGWWLIPVALLLVLARSVFKELNKLFKKKDDVVIMSRKDFEANYEQRKPQG